MRRSIVTRAGLGIASLALGALLILNLKAPDDIAADAVPATGSGTGTGAGNGSGATAGSSPRPAASGSTATAGTSGTKTVDGSLISTRYGPVQVELTIANGKIVSATAIQLPSGGRSGMISAYVEPVLTSETLTAQSAQIDLVSGATYTSTAYERSLQSALDKAGL